MNADQDEFSRETGCRPAVPSDLIEVLAGLRRPLVVGHVVPDADCLGSMLAVATTWPGDHADDAAVCLPACSVSQRLAFMVDWAGVRVVDGSGLADADGFVVLDTAKPERCNVGGPASTDWMAGRPVVNIDHHQTNTRFGTVNWVVSEASSAAELVFDAIRAAGRPLTATAASLLFAGLHADTRGFTVDGVQARSLAVAAELVEAGARVGEIGERLYRSRSEREFELLKLIHANTRLVADGRIALSTADHAEIAACGCGPADIDEQVEVPRSVAGIRMALLFTEGIPGRVRINLRGESGVSVLPLALELGGGGHVAAAGVVVEGSLSDAVNMVLTLAEKHLSGC
ncbi:MAG: hypothetical protein GY778_01540 [bacterium]|nr:hypothetical protein [bacterium]